jgi:hypothetical protein
MFCIGLLISVLAIPSKPRSSAFSHLARRSAGIASRTRANARIQREYVHGM